MSFLARKPADSAGAGPNVGSTDTSALTHLREHDQGLSLMDRAQRQRQTQTEFGARAQALLQQAATSSLPQEAQLAALDRQSAQLADAERTQAGYRRLRERYDPDELDRSLQQVGAIADPVKQRESLTRLQASYATFAFHPELARRIDAQFAEFEPVVQRREDAALRAAILAGRYAPTLADARQIYPGRKINTLMAPGSKTPVYVPERFADPDLEAEAVQVIQNAYHLAKVTGRRSHLEAALDDPAVRQVSRIPGNRASVVFGQRLYSLSEPEPLGSKPLPPEAAGPELMVRSADSMYTDHSVPGVSTGGEAAAAGKPGEPNSDITLKQGANTVSALTYDGTTLTIHYVSGKTSRYPASSGRPGVTDPTLRDQGPIPAGVYLLNRSDITPGGFLRNLRGDWGRFRVPLQPVPGAGETFGRGGFFLHGGSRPGSAGCIDCGGADETIFPILQRQIDPVPVIVTLPSRK